MLAAALRENGSVNMGKVDLVRDANLPSMLGRRCDGILAFFHVRGEQSEAAF